MLKGKFSPFMQGEKACIRKASIRRLNALTQVLLNTKKLWPKARAFYR